MVKGYYCISEYGYIASKKNACNVDKGSALVEEKTFEELESFILKNKDRLSETEASEVLTIAYKKGIGKILKAQNYVGLIQIKSGVVVEILPKIYSEDEEASYEKTISIFLRMLRSFKEFPFKKFDMANLKISKKNLMDVFISMFLQELGILIKKGIKSAYIEREDNLNFYKGKLNINRHIKHNAAHKERFYLSYDEYSTNRAENKIIKSTLLYLKKRTYNSNLQKNIREYIFALDEVEESKNVNLDFKRCSANRIMSQYDLVLKWCKIFLNDKSFNNYKGKAEGYALLYPMEKVFERYVAKNIKEYEGFRDFDIYTQHSKFYLLEQPKMFKLKPDIVMEIKERVIILDTKWKLLNSDYSLKYGIAQSDLYQMYAYAKKYKAQDIILIYPSNGWNDELNENITMFYEEDIRVTIFFVDLDNIKESMDKLEKIVGKFDICKLADKF